MPAVHRVELATTHQHRLRAEARKVAKRVLEASNTTDPQELHDACVSATAVLSLVAAETEEG